MIGVAFQFEQQANLDILVRIGMGVRIPLREFTGERLLTEVERVADNPRYRAEAQRIQPLVRHTDGAANAAEAILDFIARGQIEGGWGPEVPRINQTSVRQLWSRYFKIIRPG